MLSLIYLVLSLISGHSCIDEILKVLPTQSSEYLFSYYCYSLKDQEFKPMWDKYGETIKACPNGAEWYSKDSSATVVEALEKIGKKCDAIINSPEEIRKREILEQERVRDSVKLFNSIVAENNRIEKDFKLNKSKYILAFTKCLKEYANDPASVKVANAIHVFDNEFRVIYRAKNGFGALILSSSNITLDKKKKCIDISNHNNDPENDTSDE